MAPTESPRPPQTLSQPSRKTKKSWRKNIDLASVEVGLDSAREEYIQTGGPLLSTLPSDALFQTDTAGSLTIHQSIPKTLRLKADEILARRSAVPAVPSRRRAGEGTLTDGVTEPATKRRKRISHDELQRLREKAYGSEAMHKDVVTVNESATHDPWAAAAQEELDPTQSFVEPPKKPLPPKTLRRAPKPLTADGKAVPSVRLPNAGRSYNPLFRDWVALVEKEGAKAVDTEQRRLEQEETEKTRQERLALVAEEADREEARRDESEYESEWEGVQSEFEGEEFQKKKKLRKTPVERNKLKRRKAAEALEKHERRMKERDRQVKRIAELQREMNGTVATRDVGDLEVYRGGSAEYEDDGDDIVLRRRPAYGKHAAPTEPLELVLADELRESLRLLKPEGNLLGERYRMAVLQGKIESRPAATHRKGAQKKLTEKWSSKDWLRSLDAGKRAKFSLYAA